jgi:hypothetical protein
MLADAMNAPLALLAESTGDLLSTRRQPMAQITDDLLRSLIRLIPPARALKEELEKSLTMETFLGTGDMAVRSFQGLQASVASITNDPYVSSLTIVVSEGTNDMEKVSQVNLAAGQLLAYLEGQTGLSGVGGSYGGGGRNQGNITVQKAPTINLSDIRGVDSESLAKLVELAEKALQSKEEDGQAGG